MALSPLLILTIGVATVLGLILAVRVHAFLALIVSAMVVSLLAPGPAAAKIARVAEAFGTTAGKIGVAIALASVIGKCMVDSGAADRIVRWLLERLGQRRVAEALAAAAFVLAVPVFFDTVFYLLLPLGQSLWRRTRRDYLLYVMAVVAGAAVTHCLVPPTPGPLAAAATLGVDLATMMLVGALVGVPMAAAGLAYGYWINRRLPIAPRCEFADAAENLRADGAAALESSQANKNVASASEPPLRSPSDTADARSGADGFSHLTNSPTMAAAASAGNELYEPPLWESLAPILLPVVLIAAYSAAEVWAKAAGPQVQEVSQQVLQVTSIVGNPNFALLVAAVISMSTLVRSRAMPLGRLTASTEEALLSAGVIILITSGGGAFGAMLIAAGVDDAVRTFFAGHASASAFAVLLLGAAFASLIKTAQGSSTVAILTASAMLQPMIRGLTALPFHPVYFATTICSAALCVSWMNDSGFWIASKMGGLTASETLRSWTPLLAIQGIVGVVCSLALAWLLPLK